MSHVFIPNGYQHGSKTHMEIEKKQDKLQMVYCKTYSQKSSNQYSAISLYGFLQILILKVTTSYFFVLNSKYQGFCLLIIQQKKLDWAS